MPERLRVAFDGMQTVMIYLFAMLGGGLGGAAVAANKQVQTKSLLTFSAISLVVLGIFCGAVAAAYLLAGYPVPSPVTGDGFHEVIFWSLVSGFVGAIFIGSANLSAGVIAVLIMKRLGLPVDLIKKD